jgi:hypothetical protein
MKDENESQQKIEVFVKNLVDKSLAGESFTDKEQETLFEDLYQECKEHFESEQVFFLYINEQLKEYASTKI